MSPVGKQMQNRKFGFLSPLQVLAGSSSDKTPLTASLVVR